MAGFKRILILLLIFLGPGAVILYISKTFENHFVKMPYIGTQYALDEKGNKLDSTLFTVPNFELKNFDGTIINRGSIRDKFIILTTIQLDCPSLSECGLGMYHFDEIIFKKIIKNADNYHNVRVLSVLTDEKGKPLDKPNKKLLEEIKDYDKNFWWFATGDASPIYSFEYYGDIFSNHPSTPEEGEIGTKAFINSLVLIDKKGHIRGVSGAKKDADIRNFFDMLKLLKKEEFDINRAKNKRKI